ncbi:MAG: RNA polymerase sigma factor region1.1 domain-containing protein [Myxococcota bacterium]
MSNQTPQTPPEDDEERTNVQSIKRELLRKGRVQGYLTDAEIRASLPKELITATELETFFFTLEMMDIERRKD